MLHKRLPRGAIDVNDKVWDLAAIPDDLSEWQHLTEADTQALKRSKWTAHARVADARSSV